ncbi:MAG: FkbM family methyltransferase [Rubrobacteraceae bacterium]|nr:FkbM family methyltransferase [Rubrobacteraceae bacterium]
MEFEGMAFVAHFLREGDVFVDVGANVGVYSILAASRGARVLALEPVPASYERLLDNVHINRFQEFVDARNIGAGAEGGTLRFSTNEDSTNHVLADDESCKHAVVVEVAPLDEIVQEATMLKVDVEGYEAEVLKGAGELLSKESLRAVLVELNGLGARYGFRDDEVRALLEACGFEQVRYEPFSRSLERTRRHYGSDNVLYVRNLEGARLRVKQAPVLRWKGIEI